MQKIRDELGSDELSLECKIDMWHEKALQKIHGLITVEHSGQK